MRKLKLIFECAFVLAYLTSCNQQSKKLFTSIDAADSGIDFNNVVIEDDTANLVDFYYVYNGAGVAIGDLNNDGLPDIFFTGNQVRDRLFVNKGNLKFEDITESSGILQKKGWSTGVTMADVNADGLLDIYVCKSGNYPAPLRANQLYINKGNLIFEEQAAKWGIADTSFTNQAAFFDYDKDGDLDLYLITSTNLIRNPNKLVKPINDGSGLSVDKLLENQGEKFIDVSHRAGIIHDGFSLGLAIHDFNGDGWEDIFVSNDFLANDLLYINNTNGTFTESAKLYFKHHSNFAMGNDVADYNNDGLPDVMVVDMLPSDPEHQKKMAGPLNPNAFEAMLRAGYHPQYMRNMLYVNLGMNEKQTPVFAEIGQQLGVHSTDWSWAPLWADFDQDGWKDLFITNGYLRDITNMDFVIHNNQIASSSAPTETNKMMKEGAKKMPSIKKNNFFFKNLKNGEFSDVSKEWMHEMPSISHGSSIADLDDDGDLDIVTSNINEPAFLLRNNTTGTNHVKVNLIGYSKNTKGVGSKVTLYCNGLAQTQHLSTTRGYQSSVDYPIIFGVGNRADIDSVEVSWPDGKIEVRRKLKQNQTITLNYTNARYVQPKKKSPSRVLLENITGTQGIVFTHQEEFYMDYDAQPLLPHKLSQQGPCLAVGDVNGDGADDFFVGGSYQHQGVLFIQNAEGNFNKQPISQEKDKQEEDTDAIFFDADNDGGLDLYIVSGSNEFYDGSSYYQDRLYINNGSGKFKNSPAPLPVINHSGSCVAAFDFDKDGDIDLFRGGRLIPLEFPKPGVSYLLSNDKGKYTDVTAQKAPELSSIGMVTASCWVDVDNDGWHDLVLAGEYMPITIFKNNKGVLQKILPSSLKNTEGLWNTIVPADIDKDGDIDFVAGNLGLNTRYKLSKKTPFSVYAGDFDGNNRLDAIPTFYENNIEYPVPSLFDLVRQLPMLKKRYQSFESYSTTTVNELLLPMKDKLSMVVRAYEQQSVIVENIGHNEFKIKPLPAISQRAPINSILINDINGDSILDIIVVGNDHSTESLEGQRDGGVGLVLAGDGHSNYRAFEPSESGLWVEGEGKKIAMVKSRNQQIFLVTQNNGLLLAFKKKIAKW